MVLFEDDFDADDFEYLDAFEREDRVRGPSLPIILIGAACGIAAGIIGLYIAYIALDLSGPISAAVATLALSFATGFTGAVLSALSGSRVAIANIGFSCGVIVLALLFFGLCAVVGALTATTFFGG